jgi:hypothetical protein
MSQTLLSTILSDYSAVLGPHFDKYHHHASRVYLLSCALLSSTDEEKYCLAVAAAFHDLGIWSHHTFDYLGPSEELAQIYLTKQGKAELIPTVQACINLHHKLTPVKNNPLAEAFRKADLIDLSFGLFRFGLSTQLLRTLNQDFPKSGFHRFIALKILENSLKKPWNPLPIVKW